MGHPSTLHFFLTGDGHHDGNIDQGIDLDHLRFMNPGITSHLFITILPGSCLLSSPGVTYIFDVFALLDADAEGP